MVTKTCRCAACLAVALIAGCASYPKVSRPAFDLAKAVCNVCNTRNAEQLPKAQELITTRHAAGEINDEEKEFLTEIVETASAGNWERAEADAHQLLADQTEW